MARPQITLDRELQQQARQRAHELGISFAEYIRRLVLKDLGEPEERTDVSAVFGLGRCDGSDIARHKDQMIAQAVAAQALKDSAGR